MSDNEPEARDPLVLRDHVHADALGVYYGTLYRRYRLARRPEASTRAAEDFEAVLVRNAVSIPLVETAREGYRASCGDPVVETKYGGIYNPDAATRHTTRFVSVQAIEEFISGLGD